MTTDRTTKFLLLLIALALLLNVANTWLQPVPVLAQFVGLSPIQKPNTLRCSGKLKANAYGGIKESIGGYDMELECK